MKVQRYFFVIILAAMFLQATQLFGRESADTVLLNRIFNYAQTIDTTSVEGSYTYAYHRFFISTDKRNAILLAVPTMYGVAHGGARKFAGEFFEKINFHGIGKFEMVPLLDVNTIPHRRRTLTTLLKYFTPEIYEVTIIEGNMLSPFNRANRHFYTYKFINLSSDIVKLVFKARIDNTQLLSGRAMIDKQTGRIVSTELYGEHDMIRFRLSLTMGEEGMKSLLPIKCELKSRFRFIGSQISASYIYHYDLPDFGCDSLALRYGVNAANDSLIKEKLAEIRTEPLTKDEEKVFERYYDDVLQRYERAARDTVPEEVKRKKNLAKYVFWDILGDHMLNRIKSKFGSNDQGYLRISPILNPLYLGYSDRRGLTYKFDVRCGYSFTPNRDITIRLKAGYSFKQKQLFYYIPFRFNYNKRRHAHIAIDFDHGRHIYNSDVKNKVDETIIKSLDIRNLQLDYFRDTHLNIYNNYDISDQWSFNAGFSFHNRQAIKPEAFKMLGFETRFRSAAPRLEVQYRPLGWSGPIVTLDYERGIKGFLKSNSEYERWEIDGSYIHRLHSLRSISMRLGAGVYTMKQAENYFLDFTNFRENNIPGGWNDDWSGEFELLRRAWYNSSRYYIRANGTYESPLLLASRIPWCGHFIEIERLYLGAVMAEEMKPYIEFGYGFKTRLASLGAFVGNKNGRFERVGVRFGFELFRKW